MSLPPTADSRASRPGGSVEPSEVQQTTAAGTGGGGVASAASAAAEKRGVWNGVLQHRHFRNILFAQVFSNIGTWTEMFAIQMFVAHKTGRLDDQGALGMCQQLPIFFLGIFGGLAADRVNRRTLLVVTQLMAGLVAVGVAMIATFESSISDRAAIYMLLGLGVLNGCVMAFNFPAWQVLTPRLVPRADLTKAITLNGIQFNTARIIGPAIAGLVLAKYGSPPLLWFNAATFILMAAVVMRTPDDPAPARIGEILVSDIWKELVRGRISEAIRFAVELWKKLLVDSREAWTFLTRNRGPRAVFLAQIALCLLAAPMVRMLSNFVLAVYDLDANPSEFATNVAKMFGMKDVNELVGGTLLAVQGVGAVTGGLCLRYVPKWYPKHHFIPLSVACLGLTISWFAFSRSLVMGYIAMAVCGWFWMWAFNQSWAMIQVLTPDKIRGRAMSITNVVVFGAMAAGAFIAGFGGELLKTHHVMTDAWATQTSILMLSIPLACAGVVMMIFRTPEVDGMERVPADTKVARSIIHAITAKEHWPGKNGVQRPRDTVEAIQEQEPI